MKKLGMIAVMASVLFAVCGAGFAGTTNKWDIRSAQYADIAGKAATNFQVYVDTGAATTTSVVTVTGGAFISNQVAVLQYPQGSYNSNGITANSNAVWAFTDGTNNWTIGMWGTIYTGSVWKLALNGNTLTNYWLYPTNGVLSNGVWGAYGAAVSGVATVTVSSSTSEIYAYTPALSCIKTNIAMTNTNGTMTTNLSTFINGVLYK